MLQQIMTFLVGQANVIFAAAGLCIVAISWARYQYKQKVFRAKIKGIDALPEDKRTKRMDQLLADDREWEKNQSRNTH